MKTFIKIFTILTLIISFSIAKDNKSKPHSGTIVKNLNKKVKFFKKLKREISKIKKYRKKRRR